MHLLADPRELVHRRVVPPFPLLHPQRNLRHLLVQRLRLGLHGGLDREVRLSLLHALGEFLPQRDGFVHRLGRQPRHPTVRRLRAFLHDLRLHYLRHGVGERDHQLGVECSALVPGDFFPGRSGRGHLRLQLRCDVFSRRVHVVRLFVGAEALDGPHLVHVSDSLRVEERHSGADAARQFLPRLFDLRPAVRLVQPASSLGGAELNFDVVHRHHRLVHLVEGAGDARVHVLGEFQVVVGLVRRVHIAKLARWRGRAHAGPRAPQERRRQEVLQGHRGNLLEVVELVTELRHLLGVDAGPQRRGFRLGPGAPSVRFGGCLGSEMCQGGGRGVRRHRRFVALGVWGCRRRGHWLGRRRRGRMVPRRRRRLDLWLAPRVPRLRVIDGNLIDDGLLRLGRLLRLVPPFRFGRRRAEPARRRRLGEHPLGTLGHRHDDRPTRARGVVWQRNFQ